MKSSFEKLRKFVRKSDGKDKRDFQFSMQLDELAQADQDMQDMQDCYNSLLSAAAAVTNGAYEFSEALQELGACLLGKIALHDDEESGRILLILGQVQFELQNLVDIYEMKRQCIEKRDVSESMMSQQRDKGKSKSGRNESLTMQQLQAARKDYDEDKTLWIFRLKSLKLWQSQSLLIQAARHHSAQLNFFWKGFKALEVVEPHVRMGSQHKHIDFLFSALEDNGAEDRHNSYSDNDVAEFGFNYRANKNGHDVVSTSRNLMNLEKAARDAKVPSREHSVGRYSTSLVAEKKIDPADQNLACMC